MSTMSIKEYVHTAVEVRKLKFLELVRFDSKIASFLLFVLYVARYYTTKYTKGDAGALVVAGKIFRHIRFGRCRRFSENVLKKSIAKHGVRSVGSQIRAILEIDAQTIDRLRSSFDKTRPFDSRLIILSSPEQGKRGVIAVKYTNYFKYLPAIFDIERLCNDYVLVLEPSSCGYFDEDLLCLMDGRTPIVVQTPEVVDHEFLKKLNTNLIPIDLGANCWTDYRVFYPLKDSAKTYDIIMVSLWADVKRHYHLFEALSKSSKKHKIKVVLVGVPWPKTLQDIERLAEYYGVSDCIEYFQHLAQSEINELLNKSKVYLLLSKKEGVNKALTEAHFANVPGFLLSGYNFGYWYPYMNEKTGGFIEPSRLTNFIDNIDDLLLHSQFSPREWVAGHMSPETSVDKLKNKMKEIEITRNIEVNKELELKINNPDYDYIDQRCWATYSPYYKKLPSYFRQSFRDAITS